jgi:para-nitrobenzyl esterase
VKDFNSNERIRARRLLGILASVAAIPLVTSAAAAQTVQAPVGQIAGTQSGGLNLYQGIPYAKAPVGALRWSAPQPADPFRETFVADKPGNECVQKAIFWRPDKPASWTEDCLTLTVYTPTSGGTNRPVIVGFHGGGSVNGAKTDWDPRELARAGNIVVTINYRLGAVGFLALAELNAESKDGQSSGNYGDLDKIQALRWVKDNIAAFGGDPGRVTIAGQSAGARGVCFALASPEAKGLFQGAIIESGRDCPSVSNADAIKSAEKFVAAIGCTSASERLACLRSKAPAEIIDAQTKSSLPINTVHGGYAQPLAATKAFETGDFNRVPTIIGNTRNETRVFIYEANDLLDQPVDRAQYEEAVRSRMGDKANAVLSIYASTAEKSPGLALGDFDTAQRYVCPTSQAVEALAKWTPTYAYEFADNTAPLRPYASVPSSFDLGAPHSAELPYVWGENTVVGGLTDAQKKLAEGMRGFWSSLTAPGGPTGPSKWPAFTAEARQRIVFLEGGMTELISEDQYRKNHHCDLFGSKSG